MAERQKASIAQIICLAIGIIIGFVAMGLLGLGGVIGGAIAGGGGALLGFILFAAYQKIRG